MTGGTIDSYYNPTKDTVEPLEHSVIPQFLQSLKLYDEIEYTEVCMKDSRSLTDEDIKKVLEMVENSSHTKIIITHGTYTMPDTARFLKENLKRKDQTIILTGSMIPLTGFSPSDAPFNLGYAMAKIEDIGGGIFLVMNGRLFSPDEVVKWLSEGRFSSIFDDK